MSDSMTSLLCGSIAGACATMVGAPFDTIKVKLQTSTTRFNGFGHCLYKTVREENFLSLYRGVTPAITSAIVENSVVFFSNSIIKQIWLVGKSFSSPYQASNLKPKIQDLSLTELACIGGLAGVFSATAICPAETIKCQMQVQASSSPSFSTLRVSRNRSVMYCVKKLIREEGMKGLFRGLSALYARDIPFNFIFFGSYETNCKLVCKYKNKKKDDLLHLDLMFCGGLAGVMAWSVCIPFDTVKSQLQTQKKQKTTGFFKVFSKIYQTYGVKGFYKGYSAAVLRAFPTNGALFMTYELMERFVRNLSM